MNPRLLKTFLAVARSGNITRAAEEVHLAQSSVSDQIQSLEIELGTSLFTRSRLGLKLTPAGETFKSFAEEILLLTGEAKLAVGATAGQAVRSVSVGALETIASAKLARWLSDFQNDYPDIALRLKIASSSELLRGLEDGDIDVIFCFDNVAPDNRFSQRTISVEPLVLIAPPGWQTSVVGTGLSALASTRFVTTEVGCVYRRLFNAAFADAGIAEPKLAAEVGSIRAITELVAAGMGLALVPRLAIAGALERSEIVEVPWPGPNPSVLLNLIWRRRRIQPPTLKLLLVSDNFTPIKSTDARPPHAVSPRS
jgi:DNA-binding transcriptional LysR family regulator